MIPDHSSWLPLRILTAIKSKELRPLDQLVYLEADVNYTWLYWTDGERVLASYTLKRLTSQLPPTSFSRIHRRFTINHLFIDQFHLQANTTLLYLLTGECLPVARRMRSQLKKQFKHKIWHRADEQIR